MKWNDLFRRAPRIAPPLVVALSCWLVLAAVVLASWGVCEWDLRSPQKVDLVRLLDATLPQHTACITAALDLAIFDSYEFPGGYCTWVVAHSDYREGGSDTNFSRIDVQISVFDSITAANEIYELVCRTGFPLGDWSDYVVGEEKGSRYCVSYVQQESSMAGPLCLPWREYSSFVVVRNGNWVIQIHERTSDKRSTKKDALIREIAHELSTESGGQPSKQLYP